MTRDRCSRVFYAGARALGASALGALAASLLLGFTTPFWVYAKSFMAEPLQSLGLLGLVLGVARTTTTRSSRRARAARPAGVAGAALAVAVKLSMLPLVLACVDPGDRAPTAALGGLPALRAWRWRS